MPAADRSTRPTASRKRLFSLCPSVASRLRPDRRRIARVEIQSLTFKEYS
jgi:hypothetical protein